jgi:hypothetical protein
MDKHITKSNDFAKVRHLPSESWRDFGEPIQRFADDLELPLDRSADQRVLCVARGIETGDELFDRIGGLLDVS